MATHAKAILPKDMPYNMIESRGNLFVVDISLLLSSFHFFRLLFFGLSFNIFIMTFLSKQY